MGAHVYGNMWTPWQLTSLGYAAVPGVHVPAVEVFQNGAWESGRGQGRGRGGEVKSTGSAAEVSPRSPP